MNAAIAAEVSAEKNRANNAFANALKGAVSGSAVRMDDVSPVEHTLGVKVRNKNLFDISSSVGFQSMYQGITSTISGTTITTSSTANRTCSLLLGDLSAGTYTISFSNTDFSLLMLSYGEALGQLLRLDNVNFVSTKSHTFTLTQPRKLWLESTVTTNATKTITDIQLELGSTATAYTPYISDFSTVTVTRCGKNLFDKTIPYSNYDNDSKTQYGTLRFYVGVGTPVTISFTAPTEAFTSKYMFVTFSDLAKSEQAAITKYQWLILNNEVVKTVWTNTSVDGYFSLVMTESTYNLIINNNIQIEIGSTATEYEPYQGQTYTPTATGEVTGITNLYPTTTLMTDTAGAIIDAEYNRDINKAFAEMQQAILSLGGNV